MNAGHVDHAELIMAAHRHRHHATLHKLTGYRRASHGVQDWIRVTLEGKSESRSLPKERMLGSFKHDLDKDHDSVVSAARRGVVSTARRHVIAKGGKPAPTKDSLPNVSVTKDGLAGNSRLRREPHPKLVLEDDTVAGIRGTPRKGNAAVRKGGGDGGRLVLGNWCKQMKQ